MKSSLIRRSFIGARNVFSRAANPASVTLAPHVRSISDSALPHRVDIETAKALPKNHDQMPNDILLTMAVMGDQDARAERLIREIMAVDGVTWEGAQAVFLRIVQSNRKGLFMATLPYKVGIATAVTAGLVSFPLIFHYDTVLWFNEFYVTCDVPEEKDLETPLEVGGFAWNWMEPPLGQVSFFLLCMQYARAQLENLGIRPYTKKFLERRANRLCSEFPQYNNHVISSFSEGDSLSPSKIDFQYHHK